VQVPEKGKRVLHDRVYILTYLSWVLPKDPTAFSYRILCLIIPVGLLRNIELMVAPVTRLISTAM